MIRLDNKTKWLNKYCLKINNYNKKYKRLIINKGILHNYQLLNNKYKDLKMLLLNYNPNYHKDLLLDLSHQINMINYNLD